MTENSVSRGPSATRIQVIDLARGVALVAMAIYHFTWDLEFFGYVERGLTALGGWRLFARCIASSFLFLVGVSLFLAHAKGVHWPSFLRRLGMVALAALAISVGTYIATPETFIFFGILHQITVASLLGLLFLRLPWPLVLAVAIGVITAPHYLSADAYNRPWLWWLGFSTENPRSNDFVPLFPWFGAVLLGIAAAKLASSAGVFERLRGWIPGQWSNPLQFIGKHSLAFYLIHQPVLISLVYLATIIAPPNREPPETAFRNACERQCADTRDEEFCARYCGCMLDELQAGGLLAQVTAAERSDMLTAQVRETAAVCTSASELDAMPQEGEVEGEPDEQQ